MAPLKKITIVKNFLAFKEDDTVGNCIKHLTPLFLYIVRYCFGFSNKKSLLKINKYLQFNFYNMRMWYTSKINNGRTVAKCRSRL